MEFGFIALEALLILTGFCTGSAFTGGGGGGVSSLFGGGGGDFSFSISFFAGGDCGKVEGSITGELVFSSFTAGGADARFNTGWRNFVLIRIF